MKPVVVFGDAKATVAAYLRAALADRAEPFAQGVTVGTSVPLNATLVSHLPYVMCVQDGPGATYNLANQVIDVRVAAWAENEDDSYDLAQMCHGLVLVLSNDVIRSTLASLSPWPGVDPDTGKPVTSFTVTCNLRAVVKSA